MNRFQRFFSFSKHLSVFRSRSITGPISPSTSSPQNVRKIITNIEHTARRIHNNQSRTSFPQELENGTVISDEPTRKIKRRQRLQENGWVFTVTAGVDKSRQFLGSTDEIKIGRQLENHIQLRDPKVSRFHARIFKSGSNLYIEDLGSTNGTYVNGNPIRKPHPIVAGDQISLGDTVIQVDLKSL